MRFPLYGFYAMLLSYSLRRGRQGRSRLLRIRPRSSAEGPFHVGRYDVLGLPAL
jgi:hypothetical protein